MNCNQDDIAIVVRCDREDNIGCLMHVLDAYRCGPGEWRVKTLSACSTNVNPRVAAGTIVWCDDKDLRPIRDQDGEDVTLQWAGKPNEVTA